MTDSGKENKKTNKTMSLTVKAFLAKEGQWDAEIRRFQVPADVSSSYDYLYKKLCDIFPSLKRGNFSLFWKGKIFYFISCLNVEPRQVKRCRGICGQR